MFRSCGVVHFGPSHRRQMSSVNDGNENERLLKGRLGPDILTSALPNKAAAVSYDPQLDLTPQQSSNLSEVKKYSTQELDRSPPSLKYLFPYIFFQAYSFYGLSAILALYFTVQLQLSEPVSVTAVHYFIAASFFVALIGGAMSDSRLGKFWSVMIGCVFWVSGMLLLIGVAWPQLHIQHTYFLTIPFIALTFVAIGKGVTTPINSALVGSQFLLTPAQMIQRSRAFSILYFSICAGSVLTKFATPYMVTHAPGHTFSAFCILGLVLAVGVCAVALGKNSFERRAQMQTDLYGANTSSNAIWAIIQVYRQIISPGKKMIASSGKLGKKAAAVDGNEAPPLTGLGVVDSDEEDVSFPPKADSAEGDTEEEEDDEGDDDANLAYLTGIDQAVVEGPNHSADEADVENAGHRSKSKRETREDWLHEQAGTGFWLRAVPVCGYEQVAAVRSLTNVCIIFLPLPIFWSLYFQTYSTWIYQARAMDRNLPILGRICPDQPQSLNPLFDIVLIPLLSQVIYPLLQKWNLRPKPLLKMTIGMGFAVACYVVAGIVQIAVEQHPVTTLVVHGVTIYEGGVSVLWQIPQYLLLSIAECLFAVSGLEFADSEAPLSMRTALQAVWYVNIGIANVFVIFITIFLPDVSALLFFFYAGLILIATIIFALLSLPYRYRKPPPSYSNKMIRNLPSTLTSQYDTRSSVQM